MTELQQILSELQKLRDEIRVSRRQLLTVDETAAALAMAAKTVRNQLSSGTFPIKARRSAGGIRFRRVDVDRYVDELGVE